MSLSFATKTYQKLNPGKRDAVRIQTAFNNFDSGGSVLELGPGTFSMSSGIIIPEFTRFVGAGPGATKLVWTDGNFHRVQGITQFISIEGMTLDFGADSTTTNDVHGVRLNGIYDFWMKDVEMHHSPHHNFVSIAGTGNGRWYLERCYSHNAGQGFDGDGFRPHDGFNDAEPENGAVLIGCRGIHNSHHGVHLGPGVQVIGGHYSSNGTNNAYLSGDHAKIQGGHFESVTAGGNHNILVELSPGFSITGATVIGSADSLSDNIRVNGSSNDGGTVQGNHLYESKRDGIRVSTSQRIKIYDNDVNGDTALSLSGITVTGAPYSPVRGNIVQGFRQTPGTGISIDDGNNSAQFHIVQGNTVFNNLTGLFIDNDTNVHDIFVSGNIFSGNDTDFDDAGAIAVIGSDFAGLTSKYALSSHTHA